MTAAPLRQRAHAGPYIVPRPAVISFSGGRTSAYLLKQILDAHGGRLPQDISVVYANTGMERPETLNFIDTCARHGRSISYGLSWTGPRRTGPGLSITPPRHATASPTPP